MSLRLATILATLVAACSIHAGCARGAPAADDVSVSWDMRPTAPVAGRPTVAELVLRDGEGRPLRGASLAIDAFMSHPGMPPVSASAVERPGGVYEVPFEFTMPGDWIIVARGSLQDGRTLNRRFDVANVGAAE